MTNNPNQVDAVDEILAFGYTDPTFIHDVHVLIGGEDKVTEAKAKLNALLLAVRLEELKLLDKATKQHIYVERDGYLKDRIKLLEKQREATE